MANEGRKARGKDAKPAFSYDVLKIKYPKPQLS